MKKSAGLDEEIKATEKTINLKVKSYDIMNRELEKLIDAAGGLELDPNEIKVITTTRLPVMNFIVAIYFGFRLNRLRKN